MPGPLDYFTPGGGDPASGVDPNTFGQLQSQWNTFLNSPQGQGALLSIGAGLAQPPAWGQSGFAHAMGSLAAGGEAIRTGEKMDLAQQEAASKQELRSATAMKAEAGASVAGANANAAQTRLQLQQVENTRKQEQGDVQRRTAIAVAYGRYKDQIEKGNLLKKTPDQPLSYQDWLRANGLDSVASPVASQPAMTPGAGLPPGVPPGSPSATGPNGQKIYQTPNGLVDQNGNPVSM